MRMSHPAPRPTRRGLSRVKLRPWYWPPTPRSSTRADRRASAASGSAGAVAPVARRTEQQQFRAVDVDRIADAQHRHAPHRPPVDVHGARAARRSLQPDAAAVDAQLRERGAVGASGRERAIRIAADAMQARADREVGLARVGEAQSQGIHRAEI